MAKPAFDDFADPRSKSTDLRLSNSENLLWNIDVLNYGVQNCCSSVQNISTMGRTRYSDLCTCIKMSEVDVKDIQLRDHQILSNFSGRNSGHGSGNLSRSLSESAKAVIVICKDLPFRCDLNTYAK